jgi:hypothetical protein
VVPAAAGRSNFTGTTTMPFTLENCGLFLDAAIVYLDQIEARGKPFWSPSDVAEEKEAYERLRKAYVNGGFTQEGIIHRLPIDSSFPE